DGADDLMQYLAAKLPVHVITNGFPSSQQHRWRKAGWDGLLHGITVSAAVGVQKPEADIFHIAMAAVGVTDPGRCLMIGDTLEADVRGPQNVGMKGCWYQRKGAENNTDIQPDYVVTQLSDIKELV
ncbi:MAG: HAD family hydrolase, partial [Reinekea sp.]|nr:HAD family hydrolase [Reinekea sp.]